MPPNMCHQKMIPLVNEILLIGLMRAAGFKSHMSGLTRRDILAVDAGLLLRAMIPAIQKLYLTMKNMRTSRRFTLCLAAEPNGQWNETLGRDVVRRSHLMITTDPANQSSVKGMAPQVAVLTIARVINKKRNSSQQITIIEKQIKYTWFR